MSDEVGALEMEGLFILALVGLLLIGWGVRQMRWGLRELKDIERDLRDAGGNAEAMIPDDDPDQSSSA